ncbi:hypothetical protein [Dermatophilus congolensis]|uniref:hypothetical protein n=1 Tax=Dermatophilus congolensis TaxID=1863 RepID=UPI001AAFC564|nr:hypothetical protein [Dermatophilus congolensis]MBO3141961.1 hypothetical protein [Dermatophilus congolensis]MBO3150953.1 hypothetical protein [Dermatophilus congolensis]MBO3162042.1 hypothetical protein [Dermatophilus congolensis]MBO3162236.1 hypothetical protein [Dermatophilus congolensis]MBO3175792.1 hypothetical protein [Dermatophilus congolensis]
MNEGEVTFARALRSAVAEAGFTLTGLRAELMERGLAVSVGTLSQWQTGRSVPLKDRSLVVVGEIERIVGAPPGGLVSIISGVPGRSVGGEDLSCACDGQEGAGSSLDFVWRGDVRDDPIRLLSLHESFRLNAFGAISSFRVRITLSAEADGVDRLSVVTLRPPDGAQVLLRAMSNCRFGRRMLTASGQVSEVFLERPLRLGEAAVVEFRGEVVGAVDAEYGVSRALGVDVGELVWCVDFEEGQGPLSVESWCVNGEEELVKPVCVAGAGLSVVFCAAKPGKYGVRWVW